MKPPNRAKLTKRVVDALCVGLKSYIVWDTELPGFGVRVNPTGRRAYIIKFRETPCRNGRQRMPSIGTHGKLTCEEARSIARDWLVKVARGEDPKRAQATGKTFGDVAEDFYSQHAMVKKKSRSAAEDRAIIGRFLKPALGVLIADRVTQKDVEKLHRSMSKTPYQANRTLALISAVFSHGQRAGLIKADAPNPVSGVQRYKETAREQFLSAEEVRRLLAVLDAHEDDTPLFTIAIRLALLTGLRKQNILSLEWSFVDTGNETLNLPDTKAGKLSLPLSDHACALLESIRALTGGGRYVFPAARGDGHAIGLQKFWSKIRAEAHLNDVRIHDLRHSFASIAATSGTSLLVIGKLLGHKSAAMTQRYAHLGENTLRDAANKVGERLSGNVEEAPNRGTNGGQTDIPNLPRGESPSGADDGVATVPAE